MNRNTILILLSTTFLSFAQVDTLWVKRHNGPGNYTDTPCALEIDNNGNVYVTGSVSVGGPSSFTSDYATIKYDANGDSLWLVHYNGQWDEEDHAVGIKVDENHNIYVCGYSMGAEATFDYTTIKYDSTGAAAWISNISGPWGDHDYPTDFAMDDSGNIYVTGYTNSSWMQQDYMTIKYDSMGDTLWLRIYNHAANNNDVATGLAVDQYGNAYVTGRSWDYVTQDDYLTIKYDANGNEVWIARHNGVADSADGANDVVVDSSGNVYIAGSSWFPGSGNDIVTIKYDVSGDTIWTRRYSGSGNSDDNPTKILADISGNVYVTGYSRETTIDYCTIKYDSNGNQLWVRTYDGLSSNVDRAHAMAIDDSGNVYITGESINSGIDNDYATIKYSSNGAQIWVAYYDGPANSHDRAYALALDDNGYVYVTGESFGGPGAYMDYLTIKYLQETGIEEIIPTKCLPAMTIRNSIFLNESEIAITLSKPDNASLRIYDIQGRLIKTLVNAYFEEGEYYVRWMGYDTHEREVPAGVYLVRLMTSSNEITQKIIKLH